MRQWIRVAVVASAALASVAAPAGQVKQPTVDELLAKYFSARGGLERLKSVTTLRMSGHVDAGGQKVAMSMISKRPNLMRQETTVKGQTIVTAFDGNRGWTVNPMTGSSQPQVMPSSQAQMMRDQADFDGPLVDYEAKGNKIEYAGTDTVDRRKTYRLKVTLKGGATVMVDLDAETGLEARLVREIDMGGTSARIETLMSDFRSVSGLMLPHSIRNLLNGQPQAQMTIDTIEVDVPVDDGVFAMPQRL